MTNPDFRDLFSALCAAGAEFLVVGAHAVMFHAEPRYTKDLDVWVRPTPENAARALAALKEFGAGRPQDLLDVAKLEAARRRREEPG